MRLKKYLLIILLLWAVSVNVCAAQDFDASFNIDGKEFFLENEMQFLVVERHTTPQVAFRLAIRAGSALEESEKTGIAHMLEHMLFKGTKNFGTLDYEKDQALQKKIEAAYQVILTEQQQRKPDPALIRKKRLEIPRRIYPLKFLQGRRRFHLLKNSIRLSI